MELRPLVARRQRLCGERARRAALVQLLWLCHDGAWLAGAQWTETVRLHAAPPARFGKAISLHASAHHGARPPRFPHRWVDAPPVKCLSNEALEAAVLATAPILHVIGYTPEALGHDMFGRYERQVGDDH